MAQGPGVGRASSNRKEADVPAIVAIHGIAQQSKGAEVIRSEWFAPLADGLRLAGQVLTPASVAFAFYGDLFRGAERTRAVDTAEAVEDFDVALLTALWSAAARDFPQRVFAPGDAVRGTPLALQSALHALSRLPFFTGVAMELVRGNLTQVRRYLQEPELRLAAQQRLDAVVTADTRVIVAHSLGSVVAYEALHRHADSPHWAGVSTLVTLGSPLGIPNLIFDALEPPPFEGRGRWPARLQRWTNISDDGDVVALQKQLARCFGERVVDIAIDNGATAHDITPYLTAAATGKAIASGLA